MRVRNRVPQCKNRKKHKKAVDVVKSIMSRISVHKKLHEAYFSPRKLDLESIKSIGALPCFA